MYVSGYHEAVQTPSTGSSDAWILAQPGGDTPLSCDLVFLLVKQDEDSKDLFGFHFPGVYKCPSVVVNSKCQGLCLIDACIFRAFLKVGTY